MGEGGSTRGKPLAGAAKGLSDRSGLFKKDGSQRGESSETIEACYGLLSARRSSVASDGTSIVHNC